MKRRMKGTEVVLRDGDAIDRALMAAHRRVIERHRLLGVPLVTWRDGKVAELAPESLDLIGEQEGGLEDASGG